MCWTKLKTIGHSLKKLCSSQKTIRSLGVSNRFRACPSVSGPFVAVGTRKNVPAGPPLIGTEPVTRTLSCELNLIKTLQVCLFLKHSHQRWLESLFQAPLPLLFQNFWIRVWIRSGNFCNLVIQLLFRLRLQSSVQP